jgi:aldose 1-epimerase
MQCSTDPLLLIGLFLVSVFLAGCASGAAGSGSPKNITSEPYGETAEGAAVTLYTLRNSKGAEARITDYGGIIVSLKVPDRNGNLGDVVLGFDKLEDYLKRNPFFGCLVGRYGNRIAGARFTLNNQVYQLAKNNGPNHIHGGTKGFDKKVWRAHAYDGALGPTLSLTYTSKDGEEGYPGNLDVKAVYTLTDANELRLEMTATTDKDTIVNLTQHSYFNLAGKGDVLSHVMEIPADKFTPVDKGLIPIGELKSVAGTPFDFRSPTPIGARINADDEQIKFGGGYDHNFVFNKRPGELTMLARVSEPAAGRVMELWCTEPGVQFYTANRLNVTGGKGGIDYKPNYGFCLEPQHFPDSPNRPDFPSVVLKPGQTYRNTIIYRFSVK